MSNLIPVFKEYTDDNGNQRISMSLTFYREMIKELAGKIAENAALRECLAWYADEQKYWDFYNDGAASAFDRNGGTELGDDKGQRARDALKTKGNGDE